MGCKWRVPSFPENASGCAEIIAWHSEGTCLATPSIPTSCPRSRNGELHKWRLDAEGRRSDREEYHPPRINAHESAFAMSFNLGSANLENM